METQHTDDCCSWSLFQKYNMSYPKYFEDDKKFNMCTIHETAEELECHPSPLFYDEVLLRSSSRNSYGVDPNIIERPPATTPMEAKLFFLENQPSCLPRFESKLDKTITDSRNKRFINSEKIWNCCAINMT